jgi:hypothetical protein
MTAQQKHQQAQAKRRARRRVAGLCVDCGALCAPYAKCFRHRVLDSLRQARRGRNRQRAA